MNVRFAVQKLNMAFLVQDFPQTIHLAFLKEIGQNWKKLFYFSPLAECQNTFVYGSNDFIFLFS